MKKHVFWQNEEHSIQNYAYCAATKELLKPTHLPRIDQRFFLRVDSHFHSDEQRVLDAIDGLQLKLGRCEHFMTREIEPIVTRVITRHTFIIIFDTYVYI